jgi:ABC-2 type transport system permease protein
MPIFDQGYQHWNGHLAGHAARWWAITRQGIRAQLRNRRAKYLVLGAWVPALGLAALLAFWGLFEQKSDFIKPFLFLFQGLPEEIREGPRGFRTTAWTFLFNGFLGIELTLSMVLVLLIGPDLISQDLRYNAIPLYLSRPMRRLDYFAGKLGVIVVFLGAVTIVPAVLAWVIGVGFSLDPAVVRDTWRILAGSILAGLIAAVVSGLVMLAFSSLSKNSRVVAILWVGLWIITGTVAQTLVNMTRDPFGPNDPQARRWEVISFTSNLDRVREALLDTESAHRQITESLTRAAEVAQGQLGSASTGRRGVFGRLIIGRRNAPPPPSPSFDDLGNRTPSDRDTPEFLRGLVSPYPWTWSVGVLAGLCVLSVAVLSTRIRSLDRLR